MSSSKTTGKVRSPLRLRLVKNAKDAKWEDGCIRTGGHPANHGSGALLASKEARLFPVERALGEPSRRGAVIPRT